MSKPNRVVEILMNRDGMTREEAEEKVQEVREMIVEASVYEAEDILIDELGLEMDYIFDLI
jgi:predicted RNase H-like HicB family nuclease